jgi:hypothetical protein
MVNAFQPRILTAAVPALAELTAGWQSIIIAKRIEGCKEF